jgi:hypothetical protein
MVESIGGEMFGPLPGVSPYYGNPAVCGYYFDTVTNQEISDRFSKNGILSCPGNYKWLSLSPRIKSICTDEQTLSHLVHDLNYQTDLNTYE